MKVMIRVCAAGLAAVLLLSGCGKESGGKGSGKSTQELSGVDMDYEDFVDRPDSDITQCITEQEISSAMGVTMTLKPYATKEKANYESEDASYVLTLVLQNTKRDIFNNMAADPAVWTPQVELGEAAFWNVDQTELIAYKNGYAVSMTLNQPDAVAMRHMMEIILNNLE